MRVPSLGVGPTLPLFTCVLREQSTNASLRGRVTELSKVTVAEAKVAPGVRLLEGLNERF
jgi:hypothetical protein